SISLAYPVTLYYFYLLFSFNDTPPTTIYTLSLHDALPIYDGPVRLERRRHVGEAVRVVARLHRHREQAARARVENDRRRDGGGADRKSTRLNSSHVAISYAVFCLKKKKKKSKMKRERIKRK